MILELVRADDSSSMQRGGARKRKRGMMVRKIKRKEEVGIEHETTTSFSMNIHYFFKF